MLCWKITIIICVNMFLYARTLRLGYVSDDLPAEQRRRDKKVGKDEAVWQASPSGKPMLDHGISIAVHSLACVFIYTGLGMNNISFMCALLFAANPVNNQGSIWISGRHYAWCALFLMMAMTAPFTSGVFAMLAATVHPTAFFAPVGFIGSPHWYLVLALPIVWLVVHKKLKREVGVRRGGEAVEFDKKWHWHKLVIATKIYGYYFALCIVPFRLTWYHSFMQSGAGAGNDLMKKRSLRLDWTFWLGIGLILYLIYSAIWNWTPVSWGIFWYSVCIAPYLCLFRMQQEIAERYCYVANIGVMFAVANIVNPILFAFLFGAYVTRLLTFISAYTDDYWLIEKSVVEDPGAWYAWHVRAHKRWQQQSYREALNCWVMAKMLSPDEFKILYNIAVVLKMLQKHAEAEDYMKMAKNNVIKGQEQAANHLFRQYKAGKFELLK